MNYVYILRCGDNTLYTGWTNNLLHRIQAHQSGRGCKYTASHLPVELVYAETCETREQAMSREWHIKRMSRSQKLTLVLQGQTNTDAVVNAARTAIEAD